MIWRSIATRDRHRATLDELVDSGMAGITSAAARDHLDHCESCAREVRETALVSAALRRLAREAALAATPPTDAWRRLHTEVTWPSRRRRRPVAYAPMAALAMSAWLVGLVGFRLVILPAPDAPRATPAEWLPQDALEPRVVRMAVAIDPDSIPAAPAAIRRAPDDGATEPMKSPVGGKVVEMNPGRRVPEA